MKSKQWLLCEIVMENARYKDTVGFKSKNEDKKLTFLQNRIDLSQVEDYRQSNDESGAPEPYTFIYTRSAQRYCINMPFEKFDELFLLYQESL